MSRIIWFAALVSLLSPGVVPLVAEDCHPCQGWVVPSAPRKPVAGDSLNNDYGGVVTEVTKDSITVQWVDSSDEKPKKFAVSEALAVGKPGIEIRLLPGRPLPISNPTMPEYMYRLTDVKVGDCVGIFYARIDGVDICDHIRISRRPDGEVPPSPKEAEDLRDPREIWKAGHPGQPLPERLANRRYVSYHETINGYWAKIAPMPHEVKPKAP